MTRPFSVVPGGEISAEESPERLVGLTENLHQFGSNHRIHCLGQGVSIGRPHRPLYEAATGRQSADPALENSRQDASRRAILVGKRGSRRLHLKEVLHSAHLTSGIRYQVVEAQDKELLGGEPGIEEPSELLRISAAIEVAEWHGIATLALGLLFSQRLPKAQRQSRLPTSVPVVRKGPIDRVPDDDHAPDIREQSADLTGCAGRARYSGVASPIMG